MEETLNQLLGLLRDAVPTFLIVLALYVFLRLVFFGPLEKVLADRQAATEGARQAAEKSIAAAEAKTDEHRAALDRARADIQQTRESERQQALEEREAFLARARAQAAERTRAAREQIRGDVEAGQAVLAAQTRELADSVVRAVLK